MPARRRATVRKPYGGSRYGNDAFVKVEAIDNLSATTATQVYSTMRVNAPGGINIPGNSYLSN